MVACFASQAGMGSELVTVMANTSSRLTLIPQGITVVAAAFLPIFAIVSMFPVVGAMIRHFASDPDAATKVPLMVTAPGLAIAILSPFAGYLVDRFGRRRLLLGCTFFYGIFGVLPVFLDNLNLIFATRLALGVCEAGILTIVNTLIADYWDESGRRTWLFLQQFIGTLLASGVILLSGMAAAKHWNAGFLVYLIAFPIFGAMVAYLFEPSRRMPVAVWGTATSSQAFPIKSAGIVAAATLLVSTLYYVYIVNGSLVFQEIGIHDPGRIAKIAFVPSLFIMVGAALFRVLAPLSNTAQIATTLTFLGVGLVTMGMARSVPLLLAALAVQQTGAGMAVPTLIAWAQAKFPFQHRGRGMGLWCSCFFFGQFISPLVVHEAAQALGSMRAAFLAAGCAALVVATLPLLVRTHQSAR